MKNARVMDGCSRRSWHEGEFSMKGCFEGVRKTSFCVIVCKPFKRRGLHNITRKTGECFARPLTEGVDS
jgi:putative component of membrane protein insertase Oxa1/YidC/SpoIIIJ protein YidD